MPVETMIVLTLVVTAFAVFASALAYGERQTRHLVRAPEPRADIPESREETWLKAA